MEVCLIIITNRLQYQNVKKFDLSKYPQLREDFEKWYPYRKDHNIHSFYNLPFSMQWGVFMEYLQRQRLASVSSTLLNTVIRLTEYGERFTDASERALIELFSELEEMFVNDEI